MTLELKFTKRPQLKGIKNCVAKRQGFGDMEWDPKWDLCDPDRVTVSMTLRAFTNYEQIRNRGFWSQDYHTVAQQLAYFYRSIIKLDPELKDACVFGLKRHLDNWPQYNQRSKLIERKRAEQGTLTRIEIHEIVRKCDA